jgi:hypothetical protein
MKTSQTTNGNKNRASSIGVAVIGAGYWGRNLVRNFHQLESLKLICDKMKWPRPVKAQRAWSDLSSMKSFQGRY